MNKLIPVIRVNYTLLDILRALFISNKGAHYRERLVRQICELFQVKDAVLTSSGRNSIYLLLKSINRHKVVIPAYTCGVVVEAAILAKKEIVYAHINPSTLNADFSDVAIDNDCVVIATHQYGNPCPIKIIVERCKEAGAVVIEDCAGSLGTRVDGQLTGTFGDYGIFSFSASKTLHSPTKGGFIIAKNELNLAEVKALSNNYPYNWKTKVKTLLKGVGFCLNNNAFFCKLINSVRTNSDEEVNYANDPSYRFGFHEWQAYVVSKQFERFESIIERRKEMARKYRESLHDGAVKLFIIDENTVPIRFPLLIQDKEKVRRRASDLGIQLGGGYDKVYCPNSRDFELEQAIVRDIVYLPFGNKFSNKEQRKVLDFINSLHQ